ncbi:hypothetical protein LBMAG42_40990 [Deltaproteobacteria bacterium]|nr:hypothetical protein LBMAG42_40990 [Deltaproteobacteria bacterium]
MTNNDVLRRLRFALNLSDAEVIRLCKLVNVDLDAAKLLAYLEREGQFGFEMCPDSVVEGFLDGLVLHRRGPREPSEGARPRDDTFDNNLILKRLRIALELKEADMLQLLRLGGQDFSPSELSALFRSRSHKHYRPCMDQILRNFIKGLTIRLRGVGGD